MGILASKRQDSKKDVTFMGMYISREVASFLSLFCMARSFTKSSVLQEIIISWMEKQGKETPEKYLEKEVALRALHIWETVPRRNATFIGFQKSLRTELKNKGLPHYMVENIIETLVDEKDKKK